MSDKCPHHVRRRRGCPICERISAALAESSFAAPIGSASPVNQPSQTESCFRVMEEEQAEDYQEYLRRCKGTPISTVKGPKEK